MTSTTGYLQNPFKLWQSADWGATWTPLTGPDGKQVSGQARQIGSAVMIGVDGVSGWRNADSWLLTP